MGPIIVIAALAVVSLLMSGPKTTELIKLEEGVKPRVEIELSQENVTTATQFLASLPEPKEKIPIAVYGILDKTGQYREDGYMSQSRVVTQGATEMLITALVRSRQFAVLDRVQFQRILNEQNLITQKRIAKGEGPKIGEITGADYIIEGAITEYDVDIATGGIGLKIAGKGGSTKYARASCAIDIRVTDTTTGEVVWAKSLRKEILGKKVGITVFSFLGKSIVEFETGKGMQEVINLVVRTLLEEIVYKLAKSEILVK